MKTPEIPANEESRLIALHSLNVLDTPPDEHFDRLTRLAQRIFETPMAMVSLVDEDRQWFKSRQGLEATETSRDVSFCGHAILGEKIFVVEDATQDMRFADNPLVTGEPNVRFYAGAPLSFPDGSKLGTLCIVDTKPRQIGADELGALQDLADLVEQELKSLQLAMQDDLTEISNRRGFINLAQKSMDICARQGLPTSLVLFEIDNFDSINESYGYAEGDVALKAFAGQLNGLLRNSDVVARFRDNKFVALLTDTTAGQAELMLERFREVMEAYNEKADRGYNISFIEAAVGLDHGEDRWIDKLLAETDILMSENEEDS